MGSRRRPPQVSAAALPMSRLPLGTPTLSRERSSSGAPADDLLQPRVQAQPSILHAEEVHFALQSSHTSSSPHSSEMASKLDSDAALAKSIAEAKLERQKKRIEEAEAPLPRKTGSRTKGKQWKPFDFTADDAKDSDAYDASASASVNEVRINTFRPLSRQGSSRRSASLVSHDTAYSEAGAWNMVREDSALTDNGFQIFKGRRAGKGVAELNAYEDKPEERQATVEAVFDEREIYGVFGNALPAPEYIQENIGAKNGQIQFIQHPNGDVSAQQWSAERYIWENIGHFSNIRKKIEGQLASDRLKGQTADQTLQQNTLAYFRTIAKQREASVMGLPFGLKEIQAAMPQQHRHNELTVAATDLKQASKNPPSAVEHTSQTQAESATAEQVPQPTISTLKPPAQPFLPQNLHASHGPARDDIRHSGYFADYMHYRTIYGQQTRRQDDPFYAAPPYQHLYGNGGFPGLYRYNNQHQNTHSLGGPFFGYIERGQTSNYDYNFPPVGGTARHSDRATGVHGGDHGISSDNRAGFQWHQSAPSLSSGVSHWRDSHGNTAMFPNQSTLNSRPDTHAAPADEIAAPQPKAAIPFGGRNSMSDQLWKITETAKERNLSQTNISRTVLYDPYQNKPAAPAGDDHYNGLRRYETQSSGPIFSQNVFANKLQPPSSFDTASSKFFPTVLAPPPAELPPSPAGVLTESNPQDSGHADSPTFTASKVKPEKVPRAVGDTTHDQSHYLTSNSTHDPAADRIEAYKDELKAWWTSGNKFAQQQEFFESIKTGRRSSLGTMTTTSPPAYLTPIGPPSRTPKKQEVAPFNETTTRLLIPVLENLAAYVQGPPEKRRDYFSQWSQPPEWCIDRSEAGNNSFYDSNWGQPPARVGRDPRYQNRSWDAEQSPRTNRHIGMTGQAGGHGVSVAVGSGIDRRFNFAGH